MTLFSVDHPSEDELEEYLMQRLPPGKETVIEEHILLCQVCQAAAEEIETLIAGIKMANGGPSEGSLFHTHLPLYSLEAAAGKFGKQQKSIDPERWVVVPPLRKVPLTQPMFAIHIHGFSMEPDILDGSLCAFRGNVTPPYEGKVVLIEQYGETGGTRYTVKLYHVSTSVDPDKLGDEAWLHERMTLESTNPDFESWDVAAAGKVNVIGEFMFAI